MKVQLKWNQDKMDELSHRLEKILFSGRNRASFTIRLCGQKEFSRQSAAGMRTECGS